MIKTIKKSAEYLVELHDDTYRVYVTIDYENNWHDIEVLDETGTPISATGATYHKVIQHIKDHSTLI